MKKLYCNRITIHHPVLSYRTYRINTIVMHVWQAPDINLLTNDIIRQKGKSACAGSAFSILPLIQVLQKQLSRIECIILCPVRSALKLNAAKSKRFEQSDLFRELVHCGKLRLEVDSFWQKTAIEVMGTAFFTDDDHVFMPPRT